MERTSKASRPNGHGDSVGGVSRREVLRRGAGIGAVAMLPTWLLSACGSDSSAGGSASDGARVLKATHGGGLGNLGMFVAKEKQLGKPDVQIDFVVTPSNADITTLFASGQVEATTIPYTNFITTFEHGAPVTIVAGAGAQGLYLVAAPGIKTAEQLKGKTIGTFQADTLELSAYDYLKKHGMSFKDVKIKYFQGNSDLLQAFVSGGLDAMSHVVPFATEGLKQRKGSVLLSDGLDIYKRLYTNDMIAVSNELLKSDPDSVKALIKSLMLAQREIETHRAEMIKLTAELYYKLPEPTVLDASLKQPFVVDQRGNAQFILDRGKELQELGYIKTAPDSKIFDFTALEAVIKENPSLYQSLKYKTA